MSGIDPVQLSCVCHKQNQYHENRSEYNIDVLFGTEGDAVEVSRLRQAILLDGLALCNLGIAKGKLGARNIPTR